jgi:hypothetical protein
MYLLVKKGIEREVQNLMNQVGKVIDIFKELIEFILRCQ